MPVRGRAPVTAPPAAKLIPKSLLGTSVWVEILLDKFASYRPTQRLLEQWRLLGLDLAAGTITDGLQRLEPLFAPIFRKPCCNATASRITSKPMRPVGWFSWNSKARWALAGGCGSSTATIPWCTSWMTRVVITYRKIITRAKAGGVLMVDRYSAYKAMLQVKNGSLILAFCWAHVRRDFVRVGKGWPELKPWALEWLRRIRDLYRLNRQRLADAGGPCWARRLAAGGGCHAATTRHRVGRSWPAYASK